MTLAIIVAGTGSLCAQQTGPLPQDPQLRHGKLPNGFTYYIRKHAQPAGKIDIRFVVNAGSNFQDDDQWESAHLVEHAAFEGSKHFPLDSFRRFMLGQGLSLGNNYNAHTGWMYTDYTYTIPSGKKIVYDGVMRMIKDFMGNLQMTQENVIAQAGAVREEWRKDESPGGTLVIEKKSVLRNNPYWAGQLKAGYMNGFKEKIQANTAAPIRFYKDWYRPDLSAIIIVGDIDPEATEADVRAFFSDLQTPVNARKADRVLFAAREAGKLTGHNSVRRFQNDERNTIELQLLWKRQEEVLVCKTVEDYRVKLTDKLFHYLLSQRLNGLPKQYDVPLFIAGKEADMTALDVTAVGAEVRDESEIDPVLRKIMQEMERLRKEGFTANELEKEKKAFFEQTKMNTAQSSDAIAASYVDHFSNGDAALEASFEIGLIAQLLDELTAADMNRYVAAKLAASERVLFITSRSDAKIPADKVLEQVMADAAHTPLKALAQQPAIESLLSGKELGALKPGGSEMTVWNADTATFVVVLANGVKVLLKPDSAFRADNTPIVRMLAHRSGGSGMYNGADYPAATSVTSVIYNAGVAGYDKFQLEDWMFKKNINAGPYITDTETTFAGGSPEAEVESLLQLAYLYFTAPRKDTVAFRSWLRDQKIELATKSVAPFSILQTVNQKMLGARDEPSYEDLAHTDMARVYRIYEERFGNAGEFLFVFRGNFDKQRLRELLEKYLGNLPTGKSARNYDVSMAALPNGPISIAVPIKTSNRALVQLNFPAGDLMDFDDRNAVSLAILGNVYNMRIFERLRTKEGGTYTPMGGSHGQRISVEKGSCRLFTGFSCAPENVDRLIAAAKEEFQRLKKEGFTEEEFVSAKKAVKEMLKLKIYDDVREATRQLAIMYRYRLPATDDEMQLDAVDSLTPADVKAFAEKYMTDAYVQQLVIAPEKKSGTLQRGVKQ